MANFAFSVVDSPRQSVFPSCMVDSGLVSTTDLGTTREEDAQETTTQSHILPSIPVYEEIVDFSRILGMTSCQRESLTPYWSESILAS